MGLAGACSRRSISIYLLAFLAQNAKNKYVESRIHNRDEISFGKVDFGEGEYE